MRYIITLIWTFILGQVVGYIGSSLVGGTYDFQLVTILSFFVAFLVFVLVKIAPPSKKAA
ncbi:MAG: YjzD family protein [Enterococcus sp.]